MQQPTPLCAQTTPQGGLRIFTTALTPLYVIVFWTLSSSALNIACTIYCPSFVRMRAQYLTRIKNLREAHLKTAVGTVLAAQANVSTHDIYHYQAHCGPGRCKSTYAEGIVSLITLRSLISKHVRPRCATDCTPATKLTRCRVSWPNLGRLSCD